MCFGESHVYFQDKVISGWEMDFSSFIVYSISLLPRPHLICFSVPECLVTHFTSVRLGFACTYQTLVFVMALRSAWKFVDVGIMGGSALGR